MIFSEKLQILRKNKGLTQEALADKLGVSRQAVAKWEAGQVYPDIANLIQISDLMNVSVDYLVKDQDCSVSVKPHEATELDELIAFRLEANVHTYANFENEVDPTRPGSHDYRYENKYAINRVRLFGNVGCIGKLACCLYNRSSKKSTDDLWR